MSKDKPVSGFALFALGFRPFFLAALAAGVIHLAYWAFAFTQGWPTGPYYGPIDWHSHEILFGYTMAVIAGFLLTAVRNWTGVSTPTGPLLAGLTLLWLAGRLVPLFPLPHLLVAAVDLSFTPLLATAIAIPIIRARKVRNAAFPIIVFAMAGANLLVHLDVLAYTKSTARLGTYLMLYLVILMITVIFGRIFPFFAGRVLPESPARKWFGLEIGCIASVIAVGYADLWAPHLMTPICLAAATCHGLRLFGFYPRGLWSHPLLWVLFVGYAWLPLGFLLQAAARYGYLSPFAALHALTAGGIGVLTLGMMVRVSLGHTGRPLKPGPFTVGAFVIVNLAVFSRTLLPLFDPMRYMLWIKLSTVLWVLAFFICLITLFPLLWRPRPDGKPG